MLGDAAFSSADYYERLKREAPENVHFHGWVDDLPAKVNEIGLQVCLVPSRVKEAAPLVPLQMAALSCLVIVRKLGALEDVAHGLNLRKFDEDKELLVLIAELCRNELAILTGVTQNAYAGIPFYSHDEFQKRLMELLQNL